MKPPLASVLVLLFILATVLALTGCRTSEVMSCRLTVPPNVTSCGAITINQYLYADDIGVEQGKTVEAAASAAASIAATVRDITGSYGGDAKGGDNTGAGGTDAKAEPAPPTPAEPPPSPSTESTESTESTPSTE